MFDVNKIKNDFPMFKNNKEMQGKNFVYFDNASTTFKPQSVIEKINKYYTSECVNSHRGDYDIAHKVDEQVLKTRRNVAKFINADINEVVFTSGATMSLNLIARGYGEKFLNKGDEILINEAEHASDVLPWFEIARKKGLVVKFIPLDEKGRITLDSIKACVTDKTKIISIAQVSNVLGYKNDVKEICSFAHSKSIIVCVDGAQSVPHMKADVKDIDCDFLIFSAHKMCGPTGIGILYGKYNLLNKMDSFLVGGGDNITFDLGCSVSYLNPPEKFEAGTLNLAGIYGLDAAIDYINTVGIENIEKYETELRKYAISKLEKNQNLIIYNKDADSGIITLNYKGVFAQDEATYLNSKGICVRSGQHCAKLLTNFLNANATVRISMYFYNTKEDVDKLVEALEKGGDFLDAYFN